MNKETIKTIKDYNYIASISNENIYVIAECRDKLIENMTTLLLHIDEQAAEVKKLNALLDECVIALNKAKYHEDLPDGGVKYLINQTLTKIKGERNESI